MALKKAFKSQIRLWTREKPALAAIYFVVDGRWLLQLADLAPEKRTSELMGKDQFKEKAISETKRRAKYTLEFKMEAVPLVKGGQASSVTAKILGIPKASLENWVRLNAKVLLKVASDKPVNLEQMELARPRAELARVTMEHDILKKPLRTLRGNLCEVRLDRQQQGKVAHHACL